MSVDLTQFDTEELVHLAVRAIQQDEHDKSLSKSRLGAITTRSHGKFHDRC